MPYRNVFIANESSIKIKNKQLVINNGEEYTFPVEDIRSVVVDNIKTVVSAKTISFLAENEVCLIVCDEKHMPTATLLPVNNFSRQNKRIQLQINQSMPKLKRIWQQIVIAKISNQSLCLKYNDIELSKTIDAICGSVQSGDKTNREAYAATLCFKALFGKEFKRGDDNIINASLNYGYAIMRSYIAKTLVAYGLEPSFGVHHKNEYNSFNLADDIIEPFRPVVDLFVSQNYKNWDNFGTAQKGELVRLINSQIVSDTDNHSVAFAIERLVQSLILSYESDNISLKLPVLQKTAYFDYD